MKRKDKKRKKDAELLEIVNKILNNAHNDKKWMLEQGEKYIRAVQMIGKTRKKQNKKERSRSFFKSKTILRQISFLFALLV